MSDSHHIGGGASGAIEAAVANGKGEFADGEWGTEGGAGEPPTTAS